MNSLDSRGITLSNDTICNFIVKYDAKQSRFLLNANCNLEEIETALERDHYYFQSMEKLDGPRSHRNIVLSGTQMPTVKLWHNLNIIP